MNYIIKCILFCLVPYCSSEFVGVNRKFTSQPHCEGSQKNVIIERFFNIIFTEFQATPPVCVCVQMCVGQSTYCYPNACLKRDDLRRVDAPQPPAEVAATVGPEKQLMFVIDNNADFERGLLEDQIDDKTHDTATSTKKPIKLYNADLFKEFSTFKKFKKTFPQVELRYNLRESVKNLKSDKFKTDNFDLAKTRWPLNKYNIISGHRLRDIPDTRKSKYFVSMLSDNNVAYPPKYFKRDLTKSGDDLTNIKEVYIYDNVDNFTSFSLETLIDNLIKIKVDTNSDLLSILNGTESKQIEDIEMSVIPLNYSERTQDQETAKNTDILTINMTQDTNDKNKYTEQNESKDVNGMIGTLAKRIEKQNNTSMEMAKRLVLDLDSELTTEEVIKETKPVTVELHSEPVSNKSFRSANIETTPKTQTDEITSTTVANVIEATVTKKVKRRMPRKLGSKTTN